MLQVIPTRTWGVGAGFYVNGGRRKGGCPDPLQTEKRGWSIGDTLKILLKRFYFVLCTKEFNKVKWRAHKFSKCPQISFLWILATFPSIFFGCLNCETTEDIMRIFFCGPERKQGDEISFVKIG